MKSLPTQLEVEFICRSETYNYGLAVFEGKIVEEWLYKTGKKKDELIYERILTKGTTKININNNLRTSPEDALRFKLYEEELLAEHQTLLGMLSKAKKTSPDIANAFHWFENTLTITKANAFAHTLPLILYYDPAFRTFTNDLLRTLYTGVKKIALQSVDINSYFGLDDMDQINEIKNNLEFGSRRYEIIHDPNSRHIAFAVKEGEKIVVKRLITHHHGETKNEVVFDMVEESDGTQRLLDFLPALFEIISREKVFIIDEIDKSIHPHLLKKLLSKFINDEDTKGQLIFTTHDSNLLDQHIFRQDEIWFAEKKKTDKHRCTHSAITK